MTVLRYAIIGVAAGAILGALWRTAESSAAAPGPGPSSPSTSSPPRILLIGDSHVPDAKYEPGGLSANLKPLAAAAGSPFTWHGKGGTMTVQWAPPSGAKGWHTDINAELDAATQKLGGAPEVVLISLGGNDGATLKAFPADTALLPGWGAAAKRIVDAVKARGGTAIWLESPKFPWDEVMPAIKAYWVNAGAVVLPGHDLDVPRSDGIHLTPDGYRTWAWYIWAWLANNGYVAGSLAA